ncbi:MAG: hypothetical protein IT440_02730 [Phycisphaeraceae bacterium]|nr:hypothetical protein [Phycisphaeraceae bacterium]
MRKVLLKLACFLAVQIMIAAAIVHAYRPNPHSYMAASRDKQALLDRTPSPRILLVGGSHVAFGTDSPTLEKATGLPVVNLGLHAGLGLNFILAQAEQAIRSGDVVVVCPVYTVFATTPPTMALLQDIEQQPGDIRCLDPGTLPTLLDTALFAYGRTVVRSVVDRCLGQPDQPKPPYRRDGFNAWGDVVAHRTMKPAGPLKNASLIDSASRVTQASLSTAITRLNRFQAFCCNQGATIWFAWPPALNSELDQHQDVIDNIVAAADRDLLIPQLNRPGDVAYPVEWFFDTAYHLNNQGVQVHSSRLAANLAQRLHIAPSQVAWRESRAASAKP